MPLTHTIEFPYSTGKTLTVKLFPEIADTLLDTQAATEGVNRLSRYHVSFTGNAAGTYAFVVFLSSIPVYTDMVDLGAASGTYFGRLESPLSLSQGGNGPNAVQIIVENPDTDPVQNAWVNLAPVGGGQSYSVVTDVTGTANFSLATGDWVVSIIAAGFNIFSPVTLSVPAPTTTYVLTPAATPTPAVPPFVLAQTMIYDGEGNAVVGHEVRYKLISIPTGMTGSWFLNEWLSTVSDGSGAIYIDVLPGATYEFEVTSGNKRVLISASAEDGYELPSLVVRPCC